MVVNGFLLQGVVVVRLLQVRLSSLKPTQGVALGYVIAALWAEEGAGLTLNRTDPLISTIWPTPSCLQPEGLGQHGPGQRPGYERHPHLCSSA